MATRRVDMPNNLWNETGHNSIDDRNTEAIRLIEELAVDMEPMQAHERQFVTDNVGSKKNETSFVVPASSFIGFVTCTRNTSSESRWVQRQLL